MAQIWAKNLGMGKVKECETGGASRDGRRLPGLRCRRKEAQDQDQGGEAKLAVAHSRPAWGRAGGPYSRSNGNGRAQRTCVCRHTQ
jgi:hypothetical protein